MNGLVGVLVVVVRCSGPMLLAETDPVVTTKCVLCAVVERPVELGRP